MIVESEEEVVVMIELRSLVRGVGELRAERPLHTVKGSSTMRSMKWNYQGNKTVLNCYAHYFPPGLFLTKQRLLISLENRAVTMAHGSENKLCGTILHSMCSHEQWVGTAEISQRISTIHSSRISRATA